MLRRLTTPIFCTHLGAILLTILGAGFVCASAADDSGLPASVRVASPHAYLRAGPGGDYYPTERLTRGDAVEIWAIDPSGACAVRPVKGSYSWIRAADVDRDAAEDVGVVVSDGAVARIGSQLNDLRHVAQIRLEAGERVRILEEVRVPEGRHAGLWMRIEPPAGEFRWAAAEDLELPDHLKPQVPAASKPPAPFSDARPADSVTLAAAADGVADDPLELPPGMAMPMQPPAAAPPGPLPPGVPGGWMPQGSGIFDPQARTIPRPVSTGPLVVSGDELADIDLALSLAVAGPRESWNLEPLRKRLGTAASRAVTMQDRARADAIDARLSRFEGIQGKQTSIAAGIPAGNDTLRLGGMWSALSAIGSRPVRPGVLPGGKPADGTPDWTPPDQAETTGRLATVVSRRPDAPRWALVDANNQVIAFISPQSPANLAPLVGQEVSVRGSRGYMPEYRRPYLVASEAQLRVAARTPPAPDASRQ